MGFLNLIVIADDRMKFHFIKSPIEPQVKNRDRKNYSFVLEKYVVGRGDDKKEIIKLFFRYKPCRECFNYSNSWNQRFREYCTSSTIQYSLISLSNKYSLISIYRAINLLLE